MKKVALLIDGGWFCHALKAHLSPLPIGVTAPIIYKNAKSCIEADEDLFRIFYYDSMPYDKASKNPISQAVTDYSKTNAFAARLRLFKELGEMSLVALRRGVLKPRGWALTESYEKSLLAGKSPAALQPADVFLSLEQKGVDMRIGIDVATLALKHIVDRIILVSGDLDMIPAMKLARREGIQVALVSVGSWRLPPELIEDTDWVRKLSPVA